MPTTRLLYRHEELTQKLRGGTGERTQTTNNNKESIDERTRQVDGAGWAFVLLENGIVQLRAAPESTLLLGFIK
jgi:hypothetical protein